MKIKETPFEEVLRMYEPAIKKQLVTLRIYKDYEEYYQIGRIALWHAYERYEEAKGNFSTYAIASIRGYMLNHLQKESVYEERCSADEEAIDRVPDATVLMDDDRELLAPYLEQLSPREQTWLYEKFVLGKKQQEIALEYRVSVSTVHAWRKSALQKLRTWVSSERS